MSEHLSQPLSWLPPLQPKHFKVITTGDVLGRIYFCSGKYRRRWNEFRTYGPARGRFDHHPPPPGEHPNRAIIYWACQGGEPSDILATCLLECFQDKRVVNRHENDPHFAMYRPRRALHLLDLSSVWIAAAKGNAAISCGSREMAREWSRSIHRLYSIGTDGQIDGVWYQCSLLPSRYCLALYEKAVDAFPPDPIIDVALADSAFDDFMEDELPGLGLDLMSPGSRQLFA